MEKAIGIIAAMGQEARPLLAALGARPRQEVGGFPAWDAAVGGVPVIVVKSGMGQRTAEAATRALLDALPLRCLVSFGVSGGVAGELRVGDVVAMAGVRLLADGVLGPASALARWPAPAAEAAGRAAAARGARCLSGTAVTTRGEQALPPGAADAEVLALDMETAAVAGAAAARGLPVYSLRAISDTPGEPLPFDIAGVVDGEGKLRLGRLLAAAVRRPSLLGALARTGRNMARAMQALVPALVAALEELASGR